MEVLTPSPHSPITLEGVTYPAGPHCYICKEESPEGHRVHYGAEACYSCRAFFRRAHQKTKSPQFKCKKDGDCVITVKTRRKCQACRYKLCIKAGMNPMYVLTDEQKQIRFRHFLQKKARKSSGGERSSGADSDGGLTIKGEVLDDDSGDLFSPVTRPRLTSHFTPKVEFKCETPAVERVSSLPKKERIIRQFNSAFYMQEETFGESALPRIISFHQGKTDAIDLLDLGNVFRDIRNVFVKFAAHHEDFCLLSMDDQSVLLKANTDVFVQYIFSKYLSHVTGHEQLQWLMGPRANEFFDNCLTEIYPVTFGHLDSSIDLFSDKLIMEVYKDFLHMVQEIPLPLEQTGLIAHLILFSTSPDMVLQDRAPVEELLNKALETMTDVVCLDQAHLTNAIDTLRIMFLIFKSNTRFDMETPKMLPALVNVYTTDEESCLENQLDTFNQIFRSVSCGEDLMRDFVMLSYDVPLSKTFFLRSMGVFAERFRRILRTLPEFDKLGLIDQCVLWNINCLRACTAFMARLDICPSGEEQLQLVTGELDSAIWEDNYARAINSKNLRRLDMVEINKNNSSQRKLQPKELLEFGKLVFGISEVTKHPSMFQLFEFIILCCDNELLSEAGRRIVKGAEFRFVNFLYRKLQSVHGKQGTEIFNQIMGVKPQLHQLTMPLVPPKGEAELVVQNPESPQPVDALSLL